MIPVECIGKPFKSIKDDLGFHVITEVFDELEQGEKQNYSVFGENEKWEFTLSPSNIVETIFLHLNNGYGEHEGLSSQMTKADVIALLGEASSTGKPFTSSVLGKFGGWEKYNRDGYDLHIEHVDDYVGIKKVTLICSI